MEKMKKTMKKYAQKIIAIVLICLFFFNHLALPIAAVYAQETTPEETPSPTQSEAVTVTPTPAPSATGTPTPTQNPFEAEVTPEASPTVQSTPTPTPIGSGPTPAPSPTNTPTPTPTTPLTPTPLLEPTLGQPVPEIGSGRIRRALAAERLKKGFYRAAEGVAVSVDNVIDQASDIHVSVLDIDGKETSVLVDSVQSGETTTVTIHQRSSLRPGKYTVKVFQKNTLLSEQDFLWGVLAVNPNKSIYPPGETADLAIAVLNEFGKMVCNAKVILDITNPDGEITTLSTDEGTIKVNDVCKLHDFTLIPDYEAHYQTTINGRYGMVLTATTINGTYTISDSFEVDESALFDVERITATRIFPPKSYPVTLRVTAKEDFVGTVEDTIPQNFEVSQLPGVTKYNEAQIVADQSPTSTVSAQTIALGMPFAGDFAETQGFGTQVTDTTLKQKYLRYGVLGHDGADFAVPVGTPVLSVDDGVVAYASFEPYGKTVIVEHSWGRSYYGHLSEYKVTVGQSVTKGSVVALSGNTGESTGPHLHFGMRMNTYDKDNGYYGKINPMPYLTASSAVISDVAVKKVFWDLAIKKGETKVLGYTFKAPLKSPQFYLLGPLRFRGQLSRSLPLDVTVGGNATPSGDNAFVLGAIEATPSSQTTIQPIDSSATPSADLSASPSGTLNDAIRRLKRGPRERLRRSGIVFAESRQWQLAIDAPGNTLSSIQHVTGTVGTTGTQVNATISGGTALNKMFHFCSFQGNTADAQHDQMYRNSILSSTTNLQLNVGRTPNQALTYDCYIVIFTSGSDLVVNRYTTDTTVTPRSVAITAVSATAQAFVIPHGQSIPNDQTIGQEEEFEYELTSTTNVDITVSSVNNAAADTMAFEVVDWNNTDIRVQHLNNNTIASGGTSGTVATTNSVDTTKTWIIGTARESGGNFSQQTGAESYEYDLQDANTVRIRRGISGTTDPVTWGVQVIEDRSDYGLWKVQAGQISMSTSATSGTLTLSPAVNTSNTVVLGTSYPHFSPSGSTPDTSTDNIDNAMASVTLTDQSTITATRGVADSFAFELYVQAVEFLFESFGLRSESLMRHGNWFSEAGVEQAFTF